MDKHTDNVNNPAHYELSRFECIEVMEEVFGREALKSYCLIAAFKYLWRCDRKGKKKEDIEKARWYLGKYIELEEKGEGCASVYATLYDDVKACLAGEVKR